MAKWYVRIEGLKAGPFSDTEFFDYLKDKDPSNVEIWREGMSAWVPAGNVPQLVEIMGPGPTVVPRIHRPSTARIWIAVFAVGLLLLAGVAAALIIPHLRAPAPPAVTEAPSQQDESPVAAPVPEQPPAPIAPQPPIRSRDNFASEMRQSMSLLDSMAQRFPKQYDDLVGEFYAKLVNGYPEAETAIAMRRKAFVMIKALVPLADDDVLLELNKIVDEKYRALSQQNPALCYAFGTGSDSPDIGSAFPEDLLRRERDLYERAIATAAPRQPPDQKKIAALQASLRRALLSNGVTEAQFGLLDAPRVDPAQYAQYCEVTGLLFREIGKLPTEDAAMVMRLLMSGK